VNPTQSPNATATPIHLFATFPDFKEPHTMNTETQSQQIAARMLQKAQREADNAHTEAVCALALALCALALTIILFSF
jgi:hypothetical protein